MSYPLGRMIAQKFNHWASTGLFESFSLVKLFFTVPAYFFFSLRLFISRLNGEKCTVNRKPHRKILVGPCARSDWPKTHVLFNKCFYLTNRLPHSNMESICWGLMKTPMLSSTGFVCLRVGYREVF